MTTSESVPCNANVPYEPSPTSRYQRSSPSMEYPTERRPNFLLWLRITWVDILTLLIVGAVRFVVAHQPPLLPRDFPLTVATTGEVIYPDFAHPYRLQVIPSWLDGLLAIAVPIAVILFLNLLFIRSFWDVQNGILGLLNAHVYASTCHVVIKCVVGGLRPHFYDVCKPDPGLAGSGDKRVDFFAPGGSNGKSIEDGGSGVGFRHYMYTYNICTSANLSSLQSPGSYFSSSLSEEIANASRLRNALESFPSGHTTTIFAGMVYLTLYLNAKLKVFSNRCPHSWEMGLLVIPILFACCVAGVLTMDRSHHWYDVLAGAALGVSFAIMGFRCAYAAVGDWRFNHVPLHRRGSPLTMRNRMKEQGGGNGSRNANRTGDGDGEIGR